MSAMNDLSGEIAALSALTRQYIRQRFPLRRERKAPLLKSKAVSAASPLKEAKSTKAVAPPAYEPTPKLIEEKAKIAAAASAPPTPKESPSPAPSKRGFALSSLPELKEESYEELLKTVQAVAPQIKILPAYRATAAVSAPALLLTFGEKDAEYAFIWHIAQAIRLCLGIPCELIDSELWLQKRPADVKLILAPANKLMAKDSLQQHYREDPKRGKATLAGIPLYLLPDLTLQMRDPKLKAALWASLAAAVKIHF